MEPSSHPLERKPGQVPPREKREGGLPINKPFIPPPEPKKGGNEEVTGDAKILAERTTEKD